MHAQYMEEALALARRGLGRTSPNPAVGAVVVNDSLVAGRGFHVWANKDHAEIAALNEAGELARGATLYVTLEPCSHHGRTGPCVERIVAAGITRVVAAIEDPNPRVAGSGFAFLRQAGIEVIVDDQYRTEAEALNEAFGHYMRHAKPLDRKSVV